MRVPLSEEENQRFQQQEHELEMQVEHLESKMKVMENEGGFHYAKISVAELIKRCKEKINQILDIIKNGIEKPDEVETEEEEELPPEEMGITL